LRRAAEADGGSSPAELGRFSWRRLISGYGETPPLEMKRLGRS